MRNMYLLPLAAKIYCIAIIWLSSQVFQYSLVVFWYEDSGVPGLKTVSFHVRAHDDACRANVKIATFFLQGKVNESTISTMNPIPLTAICAVVLRL